MALSKRSIKLLYCAHGKDRGMTESFDAALQIVDTRGICEVRRSPQLLGTAQRRPLSALIADADLICVFMTDQYGGCDEWIHELAPALSVSETAGQTILLRARPFLLIEEDLQPLRLRHPSAEDAFIVEGDGDNGAAWQLAAEAVYKEARKLVQRSQSEISVAPGAFRSAALDAEALTCGRWNHYTDATKPLPRHELIIVQGELHQGHACFLELLERHWTHPSRQIRAVDFGVADAAYEGRGPLPLFPLRKEGFLEALGAALDCEPSVDEIKGTIAAILEEQDLVLLHGCVSRDFESPALSRYYTEHVPELLPARRGAHVVKCIQPIAWDASNVITDGIGLVLSQLLLRQPRPAWLSRWLRHREARGFVRRLRRDLAAPRPARVTETLAVRPVVPDLSDIVRSDVETYCADHELLPELTDEVMKGTTSEQRLFLLSENIAYYRRRS